jgi:hypothetical protein
MEREVGEQEPESDRQRSAPVVELEWEQQRDEPGPPPKGNEQGLTDAGEPVDQRGASDEPDEPLATFGLLRADRTKDDGHRAVSDAPAARVVPRNVLPGEAGAR